MKKPISDLAASLKRMGVERLYLPEASLEGLREGLREDSGAGKSQTSQPAPPRSSPPAVSHPFVVNYPQPDPERVAKKRKQLNTLEKPLHTCRECRLCEGRTNLVYGVGNPEAALMFIGEGPGKDEDLQGEPFVGRAGQLLTDMIEKGMRVRREDVYIANVVKCRPPENRTPSEDEMEACVPNLIKQIEVIEPKVIVLLGATPVKGLLKSKIGITKLRGQWQVFHDIPVMPTFHPAFLLRNPPAKKEVWEDLKQVIAFLNDEIDPVPRRS
jgi:uracil-DNA glycosylase